VFVKNIKILPKDVSPLFTKILWLIILSSVWDFKTFCVLCRKLYLKNKYGKINLIGNKIFLINNFFLSLPLCKIRSYLDAISVMWFSSSDITIENLENWSRGNKRLYEIIILFFEKRTEKPVISRSRLESDTLA